MTTLSDRYNLIVETLPNTNDFICDCRYKSISESIVPTDKTFQDALIYDAKLDFQYQTRSYSWNELKFILNNRMLYVLGRCIHWQILYHNAREDRLKQYVTMGDYVKYRYLKGSVDFIINSNSINPIHNTNNDNYNSVNEKEVNSNKKTVSLDHSSITSNLCPNEFPYCISHDIHHYLLWSSVIMEQAIVEEIIQQQFPSKDYEKLIFINPPELQSVPELFHAHCFIRKWRNNESSIT